MLASTLNKFTAFLFTNLFAIQCIHVYRDSVPPPPPGREIITCMRWLVGGA